MALAVSVYKGPNVLGTGSIDPAAASLTSYTGTAPGKGRNVQITVTEAGAQIGRTWFTRITVDGGATLTLADACPFG